MWVCEDRSTPIRGDMAESPAEHAIIASVTPRFVDFERKKNLRKRIHLLDKKGNRLPILYCLYYCIQLYLGTVES